MDDQKLKSYFKFDEADLNANRNGYLSKAQNSRLFSRTTQAIREKQIAVSIGLPASILMLGLMVYLIVKDFNGNTMSIFWLGSCGLPLLLASIYIFRLSRIRQKYIIKQVEGPANIVKENHTTSDGHHLTSYDLFIGDMRFKARDDIGSVIMQGQRYIVYYSVGEVAQFPEIQSVEIVKESN